MTMELVQFAYSVRDEQASLRWYTEGVGFNAAGRMTVVDMPEADALTGLPGVSFDARWATGHQPFFQLEFFRFKSPVPKTMPAEWSRRDVGYTTTVFVVADLDATLDRLQGLGSRPLTASLGTVGERCVCVRDPDGALIELRERDPRPATSGRTDAGPAACAISASVPDLERARAFFEQTLGMRPADEGLELHGPSHEALWGLAGASSRVRLLWAGNILIEFVEYLDPPPRPRPRGWRLCDRGISHIALGTRSRQELRESVHAVQYGGYRMGATLSWPVVEATYVHDQEDFTVELLTTSERDQSEIGFPLPA